MEFDLKIVLRAVALVFLAIKANAEDRSHPSGSLQYMEPYAAVEGLSVGMHVAPESEQYKRFACRPSDQFSNSIWCNFSEVKGGVSTSRTILHLTDYTITYINKQLSPAFLTNEEVDKEIARLSRQFNRPAHIYRSPQRSGLASGVIATWGGIKLQPLTPDDLAILAEGGSPRRGIMVDFLINFQESAKAGLPVYGLSGGKGYVWIARFDETGKGKLRFFAADPSQMTQIAQQPDYEEHVPPQSAPPVSNDEDFKRKQEEPKHEETRVNESESRSPLCPSDTSVHWDNCYGTYVWPNGEKYVGEWRDDNINVQGTYTWPDGQKYVGEFRDGKRNGKGILTPPDAEKYVGEYVGDFKDSKKDGQGSLTWPNGEKYVGEFKDDRRNGHGILTKPNGERYVGEFKDDMKNGQGSYTRPNGETYVGGFKDDKKDGQGTLTLPNGEKYVGEFKDDRFVGQESAAAPGENASERNGHPPPNKETLQDNLPELALLLIPIFLVVIPGLWILVKFTKKKLISPMSKVTSDVNRETDYGFSNPKEAKIEGDDTKPNAGGGWLGRVKGGLENHFKKMDDLTPRLYDELPPPKIDDQKSDADESTHNPEDGWYYAAEGEKHGPIESEKLKSLVASGVIGHDTIVWRHGMSDWIPASQTEIWTTVPEADAPPPLPPAYVNDKVAWLIAFVPLIGFFIERIVTENSGPPPVNGVILCYFIAYSILILFDAKQIAKSGRDPEKVNLAAWFWLVPVYLFRRAKTLGQSLNYFWTWVAVFLIVIFVGNPLFQGSMDSSIFRSSPSFKVAKTELTDYYEGFSRIKIQSCLSGCYPHPLNVGCAHSPE